MNNKTARNDVTGDWLQSKPNNEQFEKNFDLIFRKKKVSLISHKPFTLQLEYRTMNCADNSWAITTGFCVDEGWDG